MITLRYLLLALLLSIATSTASAPASRFDHSIWDELLREHVFMINQGRASQINYYGFRMHHGLLQKYLAQLSAVKESDFSHWDKSEQLAFLINAYNAFTVEITLRSYSAIAYFRAYAPVTFDWKTRLISVIENNRKLNFIFMFGDTLSLNNIEHDMIWRSGNYHEPRIHFALNRATIGSPALLNRAFTGMQLEEQLESATRSFLSDRSRNRYDEASEKLEVSELFDWYREDFERGWHGWDSLDQFFAHYRDNLADTPAARARLASADVSIEFLEYNWLLNEKY